MNILFIVPRYPEESSILEKDLVQIFAEKGHKCYVVVPLERKYKQKTSCEKSGNINLLRVKTGNLYNNVTLFEKGFSLFSMPFILKKMIKKYFGAIDMDLLISYSPFMSNPFLLNSLKRYYDARVLLIRWDVFPQNAKDLSIIKNCFLFHYFKYEEKKMLKLANYVACNSEGNIEYLITHEKYLSQEKIFLMRNCEYPLITSLRISHAEIRHQYSYSLDDVIIVYGGNLGKPQQLENIVHLARKLSSETKIKFLFVGQGTEVSKLKKLAELLPNVQFIDFIAREKYESLLAACDIALVSLHKAYTVPNFPAKVTSYLKLGLPILALLDKASYADLGGFILQRHLGLALMVKNIDCNVERVKEFILDRENLDASKKNAQKTFLDEFNIEIAYESIIEKTGDLGLNRRKVDR
jgi:hypothetical protein